MTPELHSAFEWKARPFDGSTVHSNNELTINDLHAMLLCSIAALSDDVSDVIVFHDWHEHDGFVKPGNSITWQGVREMMSAPKTLYDRRDQDFAVRIAVCAADLSWLLRWNIHDEDEADWTTCSCDLDFTAANGTRSEKLVADLRERWPELFVIEPAHGFFRRVYGG